MDFKGGTPRQKLFGVGLLILIANFAIIVALYGVPALAKSSGIDDRTATYVLAAIAFVIAIACSRLVRAMNNNTNSKKPAE